MLYNATREMTFTDFVVAANRATTDSSNYYIGNTAISKRHMGHLTSIAAPVPALLPSQRGLRLMFFGHHQVEAFHDHDSTSSAEGVNSFRPAAPLPRRDQLGRLSELHLPALSESRRLRDRGMTPLAGSDQPS